MDFLNDFVQQALSFILSLTIALILKIYWRYFLWLSPPLVRGLIKPACLGIGCGSMSYLLFPKLAIVGTNLQWLNLVAVTVLSGSGMLWLYSNVDRLRACKKSKLSIFLSGATFATIFCGVRLVLYVNLTL